MFAAIAPYTARLESAMAHPCSTHRVSSLSYAHCSEARTGFVAGGMYSFPRLFSLREGTSMFGMTGSNSTSALELLKRDHDEVDQMFSQYEDIKEGGQDQEKEDLVSQVCDALTVHAQIEEEIFYPAARKALEDEGKDLLDEAAVEHQTLKDLIARLEAAPTDDPLYDAGVKVLSEYVKHHVKEEENELFPKLRTSAMDLDGVGQRLAERKDQLTQRGASQRRKSSNGGQRRSADGDSARKGH
jgi:hemerythrin-like domain-containing protein